MSSEPNSPAVVIRESRFGLGLFACRDIEQNEIIAEFDGKVYEAEKTSDLPKDIADHAIQIGDHQWKDSIGPARCINHSCEPNCGIADRTKLVAMRRILNGEELTFDYEMTEKSDWRMECHCGAPNCRGVIGSYLRMPEEARKKYGRYISSWLTE